ncbi:MAG: peptide/nickel transport system permease protein, partial [Mycobacterium sp.]|nr:peptide/nickel transport system permease protein [Mycobacterium sp.]
MSQYVTRRLGLAVLQLAVVGTIVFFLIRLIPGDPARASLGDSATEEQVAAPRE